MERNEAIKVLKDFWSVYEVGTEIREAFETLIPELKESEDERIRKALIQYIKYKVSVISGWRKEELIAWLEKQGSQNLANSEKTCKIEQKPTLPGFEEQEGVAGRDYIPVEWVEAIENYGKWKIVRVNEQNPAWSEEDEKTTQRIVDTIMKYAISPHSIINGDKPNLEYAKEFESWLNSLKERYTWKPSDEQIEALEHFVRSVGESGYMSPYDRSTKIVYSLLDDIKKLKG